MLTDKERKKRKELVKTITTTHSDIYIFDTIISIFESSSQPRDNGSQKAKKKIIDICKQEISRLLKKHDLTLEKLEIPYGKN